MQTCVKELEALLKTQQDDARERNKQIDEGIFTAINDPKRPLQAPKKETVAPALNFAPLENAAEALTQAAARYHAAADTARPKLALNTSAARAGERSLDAGRAAAHRRRGSAEAALVSALAVCAGLLHRLRREDDARGAGSDRAEGVRRRPRSKSRVSRKRWSARLRSSIRSVRRLR